MTADDPRLCRGCGHRVGEHAATGCIAGINIPREPCGCPHFDRDEDGANR